MRFIQELIPEIALVDGETFVMEDGGTFCTLKNLAKGDYKTVIMKVSAKLFKGRSLRVEPIVKGSFSDSNNKPNPQLSDAGIAAPPSDTSTPAKDGNNDDEDEETLTLSDDDQARAQDFDDSESVVSFVMDEEDDYSGSKRLGKIKEQLYKSEYGNSIHTIIKDRKDIDILCSGKDALEEKLRKKLMNLD